MGCVPQLTFKPGDTLGISGMGITSASVNGKASADKFGAWRVKEFSSNYVLFEVTKEAVVTEPFNGFSITAPDTIIGFTRWLSVGEDSGYFGSVLGPVGVKN